MIFFLAVEEEKEEEEEEEKKRLREKEKREKKKKIKKATSHRLRKKKQQLSLSLFATHPSHPNAPTWIWSAPYVLSSRGKLGDVAAALEVTKGRERRGEGEREAERRRRRARGGITVAVAAIDDDCFDDKCNAAVLPALPLALARQAAASERIAAATTSRDAG